MDNVHETNKTVTNFYLQLQNHLNYNVAVLGLAAMELTFFIAACVAQCFGFCDKTSDGNTAMFWLLPNTVCTASRSSLFSHFFSVSPTH